MCHHRCSVMLAVEEVVRASKRFKNKNAGLLRYWAGAQDQATDLFTAASMGCILCMVACAGTMGHALHVS